MNPYRDAPVSNRPSKATSDVVRASGQAAWVVLLAALPIAARSLPSHEAGNWVLGVWIAIGVLGVFTFFFTLLNFLGAMMNLRSDAKIGWGMNVAAAVADPANFDAAGQAAHRRFRTGVLMLLLIASASWVLGVICPLG